MFARDLLLWALQSLGATLADRNLTFHIAVAGGSALLLSGELQRATRDVDVIGVAPGDGPLQTLWELPHELREAAEDVGVRLGLPSDWLNSAAVGIVGGRLPEGYQDRLRQMAFEALRVSVLGRQDLLGLKVWAAIDEGPGSSHAADVRSMRPSGDELIEAFRWAEGQYPAGTPRAVDVAAALGLGELP